MEKGTWDAEDGVTTVVRIGWNLMTDEWPAGNSREAGKLLRRGDPAVFRSPRAASVGDLWLIQQRLSLRSSNCAVLVYQSLG